MSKSIKLDDKTRQTLFSMQNVAIKMQIQMKLICDTYLRALGKGNEVFSLSQDCSELIPNKPEKI